MFAEHGCVKRSPEFIHEDLGLLERGEMTATVQLVPVDQLFVGLLRSAARSVIDFVGKNAARYRNLLHGAHIQGDVAVFPIEAHG
jgi:hypothetical protein